MLERGLDQQGRVAVDQGEQDWGEPRCGKGKLELKSFTVTRPVTSRELSNAVASCDTEVLFVKETRLGVRR